MRTRLGAKKEEKTHTTSATRGPCRVRIELDKTDVARDLALLVTSSELQSQDDNLPPQVRIRLLIQFVVATGTAIYFIFLLI